MWEAKETSSTQSDKKVYAVTIKSITETKSKNGWPCLEILFNAGDFSFTTLAPLKEHKDTGEYYLPIRPGFEGNDGWVSSTIAYEIIEMLKFQHGEAKIKERKEKAGGYNKKFFEGVKFELEVKTVVAKDNTFYIPMFEFQKLKEENYNSSKEVTPKEVDNTAMVEDKFSDSDLPF